MKPNPQIQQLPPGFPTHTVDVTGLTICLGDTVGYDFADSTETFVVVFEDNAFRKKYKKWNSSLPKPMLAYGREAESMRMKVVKKYDE